VLLVGWVATAGAIERVSVATGGGEADRGSYQAALSDDGRYIAFRSNATNLVAGDTNDLSDVFVYDRQTGTTERVSVEGGTVAALAPSISDDGRYVVMQSYTTGAWGGYDYGRVMVYDRQTHTTTHVLPVSGSDPTDRTTRLEPVISGNGRFVAFYTYVNPHSSQPPSTRPPQDDNNLAHDIYVYDLVNQTTERVSRDANGVEGNGDSFSPALSDDGTLVAFYSYANNLVPGDTNDAEDVFVKDRTTGAIERVSVASDGTQGDGDSYTPALAGSGRYVAFRSLATNLVLGDTNERWDIFVHDRQTHTTERVSVASDGTQANGHSYAPSISDDGRYVVFRSAATNLVPNDTNERWDIFVHDRQTHTTERVSVASDGAQANGHSYAPSISDDGRVVAFESDATNLAAGDGNGATDVFVVELQP
jgi:Tol biopolymer transport system component